MSPKNWVAVASAEHARLGRDARQGYMQVSHGKLAPLKRISPGDRIAYYAPTVICGASDAFQRLVCVGIVRPEEPYAFADGNGFLRWRRGVNYASAGEASILPLLHAFDFLGEHQSWGYKFLFGLFEINDHDMRLIAKEMRADLADFAESCDVAGLYAGY